MNGWLRLWVIVSVCWIGFSVYATWDLFDSFNDVSDRIGSIQKQLQQLKQGEPLYLEVEFGGDESPEIYVFEYTINDDLRERIAKDFKGSVKGHYTERDNEFAAILAAISRRKLIEEFERVDGLSGDLVWLKGLRNMHAKNILVSHFAPPLGLLILGLAFGWVRRGFGRA